MLLLGGWVAAQSSTSEPASPLSSPEDALSAINPPPMMEITSAVVPWMVTQAMAVTMPTIIDSCPIESLLSGPIGRS